MKNEIKSLETCETLDISHEHGVVTIWLNRPEVHNAFNALMIQELIQTFQALASKHFQVLIIRGKGKSFCAGADINWMKDTFTKDYKESYQDSFQLAQCLHLLYHFPVPVISVAQGSVYGGGIGLLAAADIAVGEIDAKFCFSEVTLGLVPAIISPYIIRRIGEFKTRELMLSANLFTGADAALLGLINCTVENYNTEAVLNGYVEKLKKNSNEAMMAAKKMIIHVSNTLEDENLLPYTADAITRARLSHDGREGMNAFLEKRKPRWK